MENIGHSSLEIRAAYSTARCKYRNKLEGGKAKHETCSICRKKKSLGIIQFCQFVQVEESNRQRSGEIVGAKNPALVGKLSHQITARTN